MNCLNTYFRGKGNSYQMLVRLFWLSLFFLLALPAIALSTNALPKPVFKDSAKKTILAISAQIVPASSGSISDPWHVDVRLKPAPSGWHWDPASVRIIILRKKDKKLLISGQGKANPIDPKEFGFDWTPNAVWKNPSNNPKDYSASAQATLDINQPTSNHTTSSFNYSSDLPNCLTEEQLTFKGVSDAWVTPNFTSFVPSSDTQIKLNLAPVSGPNPDNWQWLGDVTLSISGDNTECFEGYCLNATSTPQCPTPQGYCMVASATNLNINSAVSSATLIYDWNSLWINNFWDQLVGKGFRIDASAEMTNKYGAICTTGNLIALIGATQNQTQLPPPCADWNPSCAKVSCPNPSGGCDESSGTGPSAGEPVDLYNGWEDYQPQPDIVAYNPFGPAVAFQRRFNTYLTSSSNIDLDGNGHVIYNAPGLSTGWEHNYDYTLIPINGSNGIYLNFRYTKGAIETLTPQTGTSQFTVSDLNYVSGVFQSGGFPYQATGVPSGTNGQWSSVTLTFSDGTQWLFKQLVNTPYENSPAITDTYRLLRITPVHGKPIAINYYTGMYFGDIQSIVADPDNNNLTLLYFNYSSENDDLSEVIDYSGSSSATFNPRHVVYTLNDGNFDLINVSQVDFVSDTTPPNRWTYGYVLNSNNNPLISTITVPKPRTHPNDMDSTSTATINYNDNGQVSSVVDQNGNQHSILYNQTFDNPCLGGIYPACVEGSDNGTDVKFSGADGTVVREWMQKFDTFHRNIGIMPIGSANDVSSYTTPQSFQFYDHYADGSQAYNFNSYRPTFSTLPFSFIAQNQDPIDKDYVQYTYEINNNKTYGNLKTLTYFSGECANSDCSSGNQTTTLTYNYQYNGTYPTGYLQGIQDGNLTNDFTTLLNYDPSLGWLTSVTGPAPPGSGVTTTTTTYNYNTTPNSPGYGLLNSVQTPRSDSNGGTRTTTFNYTTPNSHCTGTQPLNQWDEPLSVHTETFPALSYCYDAYGNVTQVIDGQGNITTYQYDAANDVTSITFPQSNNAGAVQGAQEKFAYQYPGGPLLTVQLYDESNPRQLFKETDYGYGPEGELLSVSGSVPPVTITYNALYQPLTITDGNGKPTTYHYDTLGRLQKIEYPGYTTAADPKDSVTYTYDSADRPLTRTDGNGTTTTYSYSPGGLLSEKAYTIHQGAPTAPTSNQYFHYDRFNRMSSMSNADITENYTYDQNDDSNYISAVNDVFESSGQPQAGISYTYFPDGSLELSDFSSTYQQSAYLGQSSTYSYDDEGKPNQLNISSNPNNPILFTWQYDNTGTDLLQQQKLPDGALTNYAYDPRYFLAQLNNQSSFGSMLSYFQGNGTNQSMEYDASGQRLSVSVSGSDSGSINYTYGDLTKSRLTEEVSSRAQGWNYSPTHSLNPPAPGPDGFAYDPAGNLTTIRQSGQPTPNADNQIPGNCSGTPPTGNCYDGNGNPILYNGHTYTFDAENRLVTDNLMVNSPVTFGYRPDGLRLWKQDGSDPSKRINFVYDGSNPVLEMGDTANPLAINVFGPTGLLQRWNLTPSGAYTTEYQFDPSGIVATQMTKTDVFAL